MPLAPHVRLALAVAAGAACLTGCVQKKETPKTVDVTATPAVAPAEEKPGKDTLVVAYQADASSFISVVSQSEADSGIFSGNLFQALTTSDFDCRISFPPAIASSWEFTPDGKSVTYHLRHDLKWSDGVPITAKDLKFTYDLVADPKVASPRINYIERMVPGAAPAIVDDYTARFDFTQSYDRATQISHTGLELLPEHVLGSVDRGSLRGTDFDKNPVVSGPWKLGKWDKGSSIELLPNENYAGPNPAKLGRIVFKIIPEYATRLIALENGEADMIEAFQNVEDIGRIKKSRPDIKLYHRGWRFLDYVGWNTRNPLFAKKEVRQALTMAIDIDKLIHDLLTTSDGEVLGKKAVSWITPELCDYRTDAVKPFPFDPERAKAILAEQGWKDTNGDGILDKGGKPFRFSLLTNSGNARRAKASVIIQANLKAIGVDAQLEAAETNTFFERLRKKDFEAALSGWAAGLFVDPIDLWHSDTAQHKYEFNFCSYSNPQADTLMEQGIVLSDLAQSAPIWQQLQGVIYDDQPYTFLFWRDEVAAVDGRFQGVKVDVLSQLRDLNEWWVPESKVKYKY